MRAILLTITVVVLLAFSAPVFAAEMIYQVDKDNFVVLNDKACSLAAITKNIQPEAVSAFRAGKSVRAGQAYANCWRALPEYGAVVVIDVGDDGNPVAYVIELGLFVPYGVSL